MPSPRLIPCLLLKNGLLVRSQLFRVHQAIGNPMSTIKRFSDWNVDELVLLDISAEDYHDLRRDDLQIRYEGSGTLDLLRAIAKVCFMPLAFGGRIRTLEDIRLRLAAGADKCVINTQAVEDPAFVTRAARRFGAQCVVVSIDAVRHPDGRLEVVSRSGRSRTGWAPADWAAEAQRLGAGEIFLNSVDRDGTASGYDIELIKSVTARVSIPVIACGGVGRYADFPVAIAEGGADAATAANIFHFFENSYPFAKQACIDAGLPMRPVRLSGRWLRREPDYTPQDRTRPFERLARAEAPLPDKTEAGPWRRNVRWCSTCVYPGISAAPMEFDEKGQCMGCRMAEVKKTIAPAEWGRRRELLRELLERYRCRDGSRHDCVIAVSGGKDSWYQTHIIKNEFGCNPLLVTYNGNNYTEVGWQNLLRMREVFGVDHIIYSPGVELLKKLNRLGMIVMGDMNWHCHVGITTTPVRMAAMHRIPLVIWGEHGYLDLCGQFSLDDFPEMSYRDRLEHFARGYEWNFFVGQEGITAQDMVPYQYPSDRDLFDLDIRGVYIGNYLPWEANDHGRMMVDLHGFQISPTPFDRTYRRMSNLDDMHENGVHDYLKYIKFGYGRCTDHACKDIRAGILSREEAVDLVRRYDPVKPGDLARWLDYVGWTEDQFDKLADTFRDPRVWRRENGVWVKDNLWDE
jgi:imidazoleglycerol phosphate synthase cyclase subunit